MSDTEFARLVDDVADVQYRFEQRAFHADIRNARDKGDNRERPGYR